MLIYLSSTYLYCLVKRANCYFPSSLPTALFYYKPLSLIFLKMKGVRIDNSSGESFCYRSYYSWVLLWPACQHLEDPRVKSTYVNEV